ncbi:MAG: hypothetical protein ABFR02_05500 [Campylobacterota bacterium]
MKTFKTVIAALLLTVSISAMAEDNQKSLLQSDMRAMLSAMEMIQRGGFYKNKPSMTEGVKRLKESLASLRTTDAKKYLPKDQAYASRFANKRADMIAMFADDILVTANNDDWDEALNDYQQILSQCTSCHLRIRSY